MTDLQFATMTVSDFRSIDGLVTVPLDAQFVLVHGKNGSGKTTLLSALELALTGGIAGLRRVDRNYKNHLVHHGRGEAKVEVGFVGPDGPLHHTVGVSNRGEVGPGALDQRLATHYAERCYLAQATLSRLLEMYQETRPTSESPLTQYVKEILRLDQLDSLADGLHLAGDLRNTRREVPEYRESEARVKELEKEFSALATERERLSVQMAEFRNDLISDMTLLEAPAANLADADSAAQWLAVLSKPSDLADLASLEEISREVRSITSRLAFREADSQRPLVAEQLAREVAAASRRAEQWWQSTGTPLERLLDRARVYLPDIPSVAAAGPAAASATGLSRLVAEQVRCRESVDEQSSLSSEREAMRQRISQLDARLSLLDGQLSGEADTAEQLARALAGVVPHMHDNDCPVCGRDYTEVSTVPLATAVASRIGDLGAAAERIRELASARATAVSDRHRLTALLASVESRILAAPESGQLASRLAGIEEITASILAMQHQVEAGSDALRGLAEAQRLHAEHLARDRETFEAQAQLERIAAGLGVSWGPGDEVLADSAARMSAVASERIMVISSQLAARGRVADRLQRLISVLELKERADETLRRTIEELAGERGRYAAAEARRAAVRDMISAANSVRNETIRQVFNLRLNGIWRDLFVRLAPSEPFVPAFEVPDGGSRTMNAPLTTVHRSGGSGGAPGTMLSAGNLNTAALTLFIALHLSAPRRLPWLVLDDPVQSMDDVHVTQFAALLRTIAREHGRRIVIAVHDRSLFDYLALELAPAREGDRLVTAELSRSREGTVLTSNTTTWLEEPVRIA